MLKVLKLKKSLPFPPVSCTESHSLFPVKSAPTVSEPERARWFRSRHRLSGLPEIGGPLGGSERAADRRRTIAENRRSLRLQEGHRRQSQTV